MIVEDSADGHWPAHVLVQCNGNQGKFLLAKQSMVCTCKLCQNKAAKLGVPFVDMTPTEFERHSGETLAQPVVWTLSEHLTSLLNSIHYRESYAAQFCKSSGKDGFTVNSLSQGCQQFLHMD